MTRDEITWAYRYLLGREPSTDEIARLEPQAMCRSQLRAMLLRSDEFAIEQKVVGHTGKWVITEIFNGRLKLWIDLADKYVSFGCLIDNYEPQESAALRRLLRPGGACRRCWCKCRLVHLPGSTRCWRGRSRVGYRAAPANSRLPATLGIP